MTRNSLFLLILFLGAAALQTAAASVYPEAGTRTSNILSSRPGARPRGMGNAFTAVPNDANALWGNPAGLGTIETFDVAASHKRSFEDMEEGHVGLVFPLNWMTSEGLSDFGSLGVTAGLLDYGRISGRSTTGAVLPSFGNKDTVFGGAYGKKFFNVLSLGAHVRYYRMHIADQLSEGTAYDLGFLFAPEAARWSFGVAGRNLGGAQRFAARDQGLPKEISGGFSFNPFQDALLLSAEVARPEDDYAAVRAGLEWGLSRLFVLRAGYDSSIDSGGVTAGLGVRIPRFEAGFFPIRNVLMDYAFVPSDDLENVHHVSLTLRFGE